MGVKCCHLIASGLSLSLLANCSSHLASPYDPDIQSTASSLEKNYIAFVAGRQQAIGKQANAYEEHVTDYVRFETDLALISLRATQDKNGLTCGEALKFAKAFGNQPNLPGLPGAEDTSPLSCIEAEIPPVRQALADLKKADQKLCGGSYSADRCANVFPPGSLDEILPGPLYRGNAPEANAALIAIDNLVGFEDDIRPASGASK